MDQPLEDTAGAVASYLNPEPPPARAAQAAMSVAVDTNSDLDAELRRAASRTGVPIDAAREFPADVKRQAAVAAHDFDALAKQFPTTTRFLADPENARLSHDDVANLSSTESTIGAIVGPKPTFMSYTGGLLNSFTGGADMARQGMRMQFADLFGFDSMRADAQSKYDRRALERKVDTPDFQGSTASGVYGGLSSTLRAAPGIAASLASRSVVPMLATMGVQTEAEAYGKYRGRGATAGEALVGAAGEGAVEVATEMLPMGFLVKNMGKVGAGKFLTGLLAREIPGEQVATLVQDAIDTAIANPDKTWGDYASERGDAAYQTLIATITQTAVMGGMSAGMQRIQQRGDQANQAATVGETLTQFNDLAAASKVRERDTGTAQVFFQSLMEEGRDTVWITPQALAESGMLEQIVEALPAVAAQLQEGAATGADIRIPIADLMATMAGPEIANTIIPHLAEEPGGFTATTANEYMQSGAAQELADKVARTLETQQVDQAFNASRDNVAAGVLEQLTAAGRFSPSVNEAYASMVGNFFAVQGARIGISPEEMAARYPLQVKAQRMPGARSMDQDGFRGVRGKWSEAARQEIEWWAPDEKDAAVYAAPGGSVVSAPLNTDNYITVDEDKYNFSFLETAYAKSDVGGIIVTRDGKPIIFASFNNPELHQNRVDQPAQSSTYKPELIVQHNLTAANLLHAHKLGGMAVPSLAITKASNPLQGFGEITILASKEMVDPKIAGNKVFGSDIYSPRYPNIGHKVDKVVLKSINAAIKPFSEFGGSDIYPSEIGNDAVSGLLERNAVKAAALAEIGVEVKPVLVDGKLDEWKTTMALRHATDKHDAYGKVEAFARGLLEKAGAEERIFTGYSRSGNQTFVPHTLQNVIKILQKELRGGENFNYGVGTIRSKFAPHFKSIDQIIKGKDKLVDSKTFEKVKDEIGKEFDSVIETLKPFHDASGRFGFGDTVSMMMSDSAKSGVPRALEMNAFKNVPDAEQKAIAEFLNKLRTLPTEYFEAKALRAVPLSEFKTAVVPEGTAQEVLDALADSGVTDIRTYKKGDEADRAEKIQSANHLLFQSVAQPEVSQPDGGGFPAPAERGSLSFADDITTAPSVITLLAGADFSTFLHESGHFFLEVQNDIASRADAPAEIRADMETTLEWFGVPDLATWDAMTLEQKRPHHETFARGFEAYLFEGKAPTADLAGLFSRFRSWLVNVYRSLAALNVQLTPEVRSVFDRMLASAEAIEQAEGEAGFAGMFGTRPEFMTDEEWTAYRALNFQASQDAVRELETRSLADMKWLGNAKSRVLRDLQRDANEKRAAIKKEVTKEVFAQPVYQAWQFLTLRGADSTRAWPTPEYKLDAKHVDTRVDNIYTAIAKFGGLNRDEVKAKWGIDHRDMPNSGVFGKPIVRKGGGLSIDRMAEKLVQDHYLDEHDLAEFEDKFDRQRGGQDQYSWEYQYSNGERAPVEAMGESNYHGKLNTPMLRYMYGEDSEIVRQLIAARVTSTEGGLDPDDVAEMLGSFDSGRALVDALAASEKPSTLINMMTDQRMLERYGDLTDPAAIDLAVNEALHSRAHTKFLATELNALKKASGSPAILAKAAQAYADKIVRRTTIRELRPDQYTGTARRAARAADKAFKAGDIQEAAAQKQIQLINTYAAQAAMEARKEVAKTVTRFTRIANGNNETAAKTRDMDMVQATRAILAEFGIGSRGKKATEYLAAVTAYDPSMAAVLRDRIDAATENAIPIKDMTIEQLAALKDEIESLWFLAKRSRQMEVDGDLLDRQDIQDQLVERLVEIGVPDVAPGEGRAITEGEVRLSKLQTLGASLRRIESWAGAKDGGAAMGPFRKFIWNTIKDPADAYRVDKAKYLRKYRELLVPIAPSLAKVKIAAPELGYTFGWDKGGMGKVELLHAILHTGNIGNKKKMLLGRGWGQQLDGGELDTGKWDAFVDRMIAEGVLTKADFDFAQGVWDLMEEMKPGAQKAHRDVFGRYFDEVTADPFKTPWGDYAGGYVPAITDSRIVADAKTRAILEEETGTLMNVMPSTSKGFTKSRVEYNQPLLLDLRLLSQHIDKVLLFTHLEQPIRDVRRILGSSTVSKPLNRVDPSAYDGLLTPWLNRAARQQVETAVSGSNGTMRFFSVLRQRAGMAAMFANVSNTVQQLTGFSMALLKVKPAYLMGSVSQFMHDPAGVAGAVAEASAYMRNRMENEVGAMTGAINDILLNPDLYDKAQDWAAKHTYFLQSAMDNVMGPIIWTGAYNQALETAPAGMADEEIKLYARRLADSAVRETQGSTLPEDVARFETGNAFLRLFTQFAGYFNMQANLLGTEYTKVAQEIGVRKGAGRLLYVTMFGFLTPAWVATAIAIAFRGGPDDEDKDGSYLDDWLLQTFGWGTVRSATAMVPVVGQTANAAMNKFNKKPYDDRISTGPAISMLESASAVPGGLYDLASGTGSGAKVIRDVATLTTLLTGLPVSGLARPIVFGAAVASGQADPTGPVDVARGAITGVASPASKGR